MARRRSEYWRESINLNRIASRSSPSVLNLLRIDLTLSRGDCWKRRAHHHHHHVVTYGDTRTLLHCKWPHAKKGTTGRANGKQTMSLSGYKDGAYEIQINRSIMVEPVFVLSPPLVSLSLKDSSPNGRSIVFLLMSRVCFVLHHRQGFLSIRPLAIFTSVSLKSIHYLTFEMLFTHSPSSIITVHEQEGRAHLSNSLHSFSSLSLSSFRDSTISDNQFRIRIEPTFILKTKACVRSSPVHFPCSPSVLSPDQHSKRHENESFNVQGHRFISRTSESWEWELIPFVFLSKSFIFTFSVQMLTTFFLLSMILEYLKSETIASTLPFVLPFPFSFFASLSLRYCHPLSECEKCASPDLFSLFRACTKKTVDFLRIVCRDIVKNRRTRRRRKELFSWLEWLRSSHT